MKRLATLRVRFALWTAGLLLAALTLFGLFVYINMARNLTAIVDQTLQVTAIQMLEEGGLRGAVSIADFEEPQHAHLQEQGLSFRLYDAALNLRQSYGPYQALPTPRLDSAWNTGNGTFMTVDDPETQTAVRVYLLPIYEPGVAQMLGILQVALDLKQATDTLDLLWVSLWLTIPIIVLIAGGGGYFLAARTLYPIDQITQTARTISAQDLTARLDLPQTEDEVGRLAATFDSMLERLENAFHRERQFTADASHELRTPLSAMQMIIDSTVAQPRTEAEYVRALSDLRHETEVMRSLTEGLLHLARNDGAQQSLRVEPVQIAWLLKDVAESMRPMVEEKGLLLEEQVPEDDVTILGDSDALIRLFVNLLDNAVKYTAHGSITMQAQTLTDHYRISVRDTGIGIAPEHLPHLFARFYRVDPARSRQGIGLGLAIAQSIVDVHAGTIAVKSEENTGTTFTVDLPIHQ